MQAAWFAAADGFCQQREKQKRSKREAERDETVLLKPCGCRSLLISSHHINLFCHHAICISPFIVRLWAIRSGIMHKVRCMGSATGSILCVGPTEVWVIMNTPHECHETCHSVTFIVLVNSHQRWKQTRNRVCFHLWCELTITMNVTEWQVSWNSWGVSYKQIPSWSETVLGFRRMTKEEMMKYEDHTVGYAFTSYICEPIVYIPWLTKK